MARTRAQRQAYADLLARYGRAVADAFFAAIDDLKSNVQLQRVQAAIEQGNVEAALDALNIDPNAFDNMLDRIRDAHSEGGKAATDFMPRRKPDGTALVVRFDGRNPEAERWLREHSSTLITRITNDQRQAVRMSLSESMRRGVNPRTAALDIVGRINRATGKREGGILGLTTVQEAYVRSARDELASGDPALLNNYLDRVRRDKRFDRTVAKAIKDQKPVPPETFAKAITAYERRLLALRGETIGRVEAMTSLQAGKREAYRQAIADGKVAESAVRKVWRSAGDFRVRDTHRALNGDSMGFNEAFVTRRGARLLHPMDTSLGAGVEEIANCRCDCEYRIDFLANLR
jgi:hypothetical protein